VATSVTKDSVNLVGIAAWLLCALFYFYQYMLRSAPSVMVPELTGAFGLTTLGISALLGMYYYTYSPVSLVAGAVLDRYGAKYSIPMGIVMVACGCLLFGSGNHLYASLGRLLQGAGSAFGFVGAVFVATKSLPARNLALAVGATQMFGMAGGSAGQATVNNLIHVRGIDWQLFWMLAGGVGMILALALVVLLPKEKQEAPGAGAAAPRRSIFSIFATYKVVFSNPQSYLCGLCAGLLFMPTTIGDMIWGVSYLTQGLHYDPMQAAKIASMVPLGWVIGCPLLGYLSDRIGRRKPVLIGGAAVMLVALVFALYVDQAIIPPYAIALTLGIASGAAMIPYSIIKEVNPDNVKASTAGAMNFLVFMMTAQLSPVFGYLLMHVSEHHGGKLATADFETGLMPLVFGVVIAMIIACFLEETGSANVKK
jgi:MFS family permease